MEKPISLVLDDLSKTIVEAVNSTNLPHCLTRPVVERIYNELLQYEQRQLEIDRQNYNNSLVAESVESEEVTTK